jgi:PPOX class probable F420-dependent enzyme
LRADGSPHVVPVGFTFDTDNNIVRVITFAKSMKARHAAQGGRAVVSQVDRGRWITLEGTVQLRTEADVVAKAVEAYAARYRQPKVREDRVVVEITIDKVMGRA